MFLNNMVWVQAEQKVNSGVPPRNLEIRKIRVPCEKALLSAKQSIFTGIFLSPLEGPAQNLVGPVCELSREGLWIAKLGSDDLGRFLLSFVLWEIQP